MSTAHGRDGFAMPAFGLGTWRMGERAAERRQETAALVAGLDLGIELIDTAEMYGDGGAEKVVADAIEGRRDSVFLVSKVLPWNASYEGTLAAAEQSLQRLRTDRLDLYLLHWNGPHPLEETYRAFACLVDEGKVLRYGVSNFDTDDMQRAESTPGGAGAVVNQVMYNLARRGIERNLLPWCREHGVVAMAYSPLDQHGFRKTGALERVAERHGCTPWQVALAWTFREPGTSSVFKSSDSQHVRENVAAASIRLTPADLADLDRDYPCPARDVPLDTA